MGVLVLATDLLCQQAFSFNVPNHQRLESALDREQDFERSAGYEEKFATLGNHPDGRENLPLRAELQMFWFSCVNAIIEDPIIQGDSGLPFVRYQTGSGGGGLDDSLNIMEDTLTEFLMKPANLRRVHAAIRAGD